jgi:hypothetical protein
MDHLYRYFDDEERELPGEFVRLARSCMNVKPDNRPTLDEIEVRLRPMRFKGPAKQKPCVPTSPEGSDIEPDDSDGIPVPPWPTDAPKLGGSPVRHKPSPGKSPMPRRTSPEKPRSRRESWCPEDDECMYCRDYKNGNKMKQACKLKPKT